MKRKRKTPKGPDKQSHNERNWHRLVYPPTTKSGKRSLPKCENRPHAFPYSLGTTGPRAFAQQAPSDLNVLLETGEPACEPNTGLTKLGYLKATFWDRRSRNYAQPFIFFLFFLLNKTIY